MRVVAWLFRAVLFLVALGFALSNTAITELRFFGIDVSWHAPLVVFLLAFLVAGAALGLLGVMPSLFRQRREIGRLRREIRIAAKTAAANVPPPPDVPRQAAPSEPPVPLGM